LMYRAYRDLIGNVPAGKQTDLPLTVRASDCAGS